MTEVAKSTDSVFLHNMKKQHEIEIWGHKIIGVDFYTSGCIELTEKDMAQDFCGARDLNPPPRTVLDLGANVGIFSVLMAKEYNAKVFAVEAVPHNVENLGLTVAHNHMQDHIVVAQACLGKAHGEVTLYQHPLNSGSCSKDNAPPYPAVKCQTIPLDDLFTALQLTEVDFVKVDIEGSEFEVFESFTGWGKIKKLGIEMHGYGPDLSKTQEKQEALYTLLASNLGHTNVCAQLEHCTYRYGERIERERWEKN